MHLQPTLFYCILSLTQVKSLKNSKNLLNLVKWTDHVFSSSHLQHENLTDLRNVDKLTVLSKYHEKVSKSVQRGCHIYKKVAGKWAGGCGFLDGEKLLCMDGLYQALKNDSCLIYSFGLADDWDFEIYMANLGE